MKSLIIVGAGCAGNTAAIYSARAGLKPLVLEGPYAGGQLALTTEVENFPGFPEGIQGPELVQRMKDQAIKFGAEYRAATVEEADLLTRPFRLKIDSEWVEAQAIIVASGASARWLGLPDEGRFIGKGLSSCATCDGFFYRGKRVLVVGGGDSAMEEANFLTRFASEVLLVHRREHFRASKIMLDRVQANPKIRIQVNAVIEEVLGADTGGVTGATLRNVTTGKTWTESADGIFVAIGHVPNTGPFAGQLELDAEGYIVSRGWASTSVEGVFHAGDVQDRRYRQAITASGSGCMAAMEAERFLESLGHSADSMSLMQEVAR
ncbi:MAG: thioredoxin-disulfide reductase [Bdellovibrionales bacterium]|nr:thioredoxin-disulfide reductase [Bdellovibrionales bacterium]